MKHTTDGNRRSIRLKNFDYSQPGAYFVTLCTHSRRQVLGRVVDGRLHLSPWGRIADTCWQWLAQQYPYVQLDQWVVMPNHLHGILMVFDHVVSNDRGDISRAGLVRVEKRKPLGQLVGAMKTRSTIGIRDASPSASLPIWQRNYHEHVIRNDAELSQLRQYIANNPLQWSMDRENPDAVVPAAREPWEES